ncbi:MMEL1 family protein [Megaselia abdita]
MAEEYDLVNCHNQNCIEKSNVTCGNNKSNLKLVTLIRTKNSSNSHFSGYIIQEEAKTVRHKCYLGINKRTGRLQWCPGFKCCHFFLFLPIIMLPLTLVLILLMRMDGVLSAFESHKSYLLDDGRCFSLKFGGLSENNDVEDRDLLKDVRTSFIPQEVIVVPQDVPVDEYLDYDSMFSRQRRSAIKKNDKDYGDGEGGDKNAELIEIEGETDYKSAFNYIRNAHRSRDQIRKDMAFQMKKSMDMTVEPCDDFYQYACGNWEKLNPIPKDKAGFDTFEILRESLENILRELLEEKVVKKGLPEIEDNHYDHKVQEADLNEKIILQRHIIRKRALLQKILEKYERSRIQRRSKRTTNCCKEVPVDAETKAKYLYDSCMDHKLLKKRGVKPLLHLLESFGGWPVLDPNWNEDDFNWINLTAELRLYNNDIFIVQWIGPDLKNSDQNIIQLDQTTLGLPTRDYFLQETNAKYLKGYEEFMNNVMVLLGADEDMAEKASKDLINFETELARITSTSEERSNVSMLYKRMTVRELSNKVPQINWKMYLSVVQNRTVEKSETLVIFAIEYMEKLVELVEKTESEVIANYLLWRFVRHRINNLDDRFQETKQNFYNILYGREQSPPRWKNCVGQVNSNMGMALGAMFVRKYFDENSKEDTLKMASDLQDAFREILMSTEWLDEETKRLAEVKVNLMSLKIGYPDFILSPEKLNEKYETLDINPDEYFENTLNVLRHTTIQEQQKLHEPVNKTVWQTAPAIVNAYYSRNKNQIMFPAGILQPPFYHRYFPRALNYGGIGVVIGHELTHGFDDKGRLFDHNGDIHKWWTDKAINGFHNRAKCLVSQYNNYTVKEVNINIDGESTQGENIADNGGIRQAFRAYENWLSKNENLETELAESLPGLNLTSKQLFFLNFAQVWCGTMRPEAIKNKLKTAVHSPGKFRVIGTLSNSVDFAREFSCPVGCPMNPTHKCSVW